MTRMTGLVAQGLLIATALSACNTTDALIPKVDVGESSINSPPVTEQDLAAVERQPDVVHAAPMRTVAHASLAPATGSLQPVPSAEVAYAAPSAPYRDPAGSLDAQASQLQRGPDRLEAEPEAQPMRRGPVRETAALAEPARQAQPSAHTRRATQQPQESSDEQSDTTATEPSAENGASAALAPAESGEAGTVRFLPIIGAPVSAVEPLSGALGADARAQGLKIKTTADPKARHMLKGYLSALSDGGKTTVIYVWDVLDASGNRLTRLQGQESVRATARDPWSAVPAETMRAIGQKTIAAYLSWAATNRG
ncbi:hypothetical protein BJF93_11705 [Xaviernesmea oryzae]|uniref:Lipoprotein n=1 Tax=Xaviernesmea oryzae TaxID=464029 RepID=A0A1Q9AV97_9HYPH|nr:hypothetical protein [Xaviernesmea oryzae]OLP59386.1 hypothetical protein BJF93_11705 [Xaviernesmea oryzae]SEL62161.1 hypothetical protein SAMN04487976_110128 [Xaviernesmea oryzae]